MIRALSVLLFGLLVALPAQGSKEQLPVGCVDIATLLKEHPAYTKARDAARGDRKGALEALKARRDKMIERSEDLALYPEGSKEYFRVSEEIALERATIELDREITVAEYNLALVDGIKVAYRDIIAKVRKVADERGMRLVGQIHGGELSGRTQREVLTEIFSRPFVHYTKELDLTEAVRKLL